MRHQHGSAAAMRVAAWVMVFVAAIFVGVAAFRLGSRSLDVSFARPAPVPETATPEELPDRAGIVALLRAAGLNERPVLGDIGVAGHVARMDAGRVAPLALVHYADGLIRLNQATARSGTAIPAAFWDVETPALMRAGWTPYAIVDHMNRPENAPHLQLLARGHDRFQTFKAHEGQHRHTAVDAAFDMLDIARDFVAALSDAGLASLAPGLGSRADATVAVWQNLLTGAPELHRRIAAPVFAPGLVSRFNVATMHTYELGRPVSPHSVWGRSGFAERFAAAPGAVDQVAWMSTSAARQAVLHVPLEDLDAAEQARLHDRPALEGAVRMHLEMNAAVHDHFLPAYDSDLPGAAERLKAAVQSEW